jgi:hypothetical protein
MPAAIGVAAQLTGRGCENPVIVIRSTRNIAWKMLGVVAAWHAVMIDSGHVARNKKLRIEREPRIALRQRLCPGCQRLRLAQRYPAARLLPLLHRQPPQRRPGAERRLLQQRPPHLVPVSRRAPMLRLERRLAARLPGGTHMRHHACRQMAVHQREKIQPLDLVVRHFGEHAVPAYLPVIGRPVVIGRCRLHRVRVTIHRPASCPNPP